MAHSIAHNLARCSADIGRRSKIDAAPFLARLVAGDPRVDELDLTNGVSIMVSTANYRSIRGLSICGAAICDEQSFWVDDLSGANPAPEVLRAIRPRLANFPHAKRIKISSPFVKSGVMWEDWRDREKDPHMLVWKLGTRETNPSLDPIFLDEEERRDPESFAREYGAEFYESASAFLPADAIEACVVRGRMGLPPQEGIHYVASMDAAFRSGNAFAFCVLHAAGEKIVQDVIHSWRGKPSAPVSLSRTLAEIVETLARYNVRKIYGDSFAQNRFAKH